MLKNNLSKAENNLSKAKATLNQLNIDEEAKDIKDAEEYEKFLREKYG